MLNKYSGLGPRVVHLADYGICLWQNIIKSLDNHPKRHHHCFKMVLLRLARRHYPWLRDTISQTSLGVDLWVARYFHSLLAHPLTASNSSGIRADWGDCQRAQKTGKFPPVTLIARFLGPTLGPPGADRTQVGPMLAPWTLLSWISHTPLTALVPPGSDCVNVY